MAMPVKRCWAVVVTVAALLCTPAQADAQGNPAEARQYADDGLSHYEAGRYAESYAAFEKAADAFPTPVFILYMARCKRQLEELLAARDLYQRVVDYRLEPGAPQALTNAKREAADEQRALIPTIPSLRVTLSGDGSDVTVLINGAAIAGVTEGAVAMDPGDYEIVAKRDNRAVASSRVTLRKGTGAQTITLPLDSGDAASSTGVVNTGDDGLVAWPGYVMLGIGGAGLVVGAIFGGLALSKADDAKANCNDEGVCPKADESLKGDAMTLAHVSTAGLVIGAVGAIGGTIWLVLASGDDEQVALSPFGASYRRSF